MIWDMKPARRNTQVLKKVVEPIGAEKLTRE
jgi:hypothetical protein